MNSHRTAISRKKASQPMQKLAKLGLLRGRVLDYGCGRGMDAEVYNTAAYDPYYQPRRPRGKFDTVTCHYVLNVLPDEQERQEVIQDVYEYLRPGGTAYFSVRADVKNLKGVTSKGTWQGLIELDMEEVFRTKHMVIYRLDKSGS